MFIHSGEGHHVSSNKKTSKWGRRIILYVMTHPQEFGSIRGIENPRSNFLRTVHMSL